VLSTTAEYALRAVVFLARLPPDVRMRAKELAEAADVPGNYMGKILHELTRARVLESTRGKTGGFRLAVSPDRLPLIRVVAPFDRMEPQRRCLLGRFACSDRDPCPAHDRWSRLAEEISVFFTKTTVSHLLSNEAWRPARARVPG
jgi:Rrf2 family protein